VTVLGTTSSTTALGKIGYGKGKGKGNETLSIQGTASATGHGGSTHGGGSGASILPILTSGAERVGRGEGKVCDFSLLFCAVFVSASVSVCLVDNEC
jgi:hypothetical protein